MATRRTDHGTFDHGAQYFTAREPRFRRQVDGWCAAEVAVPWPAAGEDMIVARNILLAELTGTRIHCQHLSSARSVELLTKPHSTSTAGFFVVARIT